MVTVVVLQFELQRISAHLGASQPPARPGRCRGRRRYRCPVHAGSIGSQGPIPVGPARRRRCAQRECVCAFCHRVWSRSLTDRARLVQATKNTITLKGSTEIVTEFFGYSINSILYQVRRACSRDEQFSRPRLLSFRGPHRAIGRARCTCVVTSVSASSEPGGRHVRLVCRVLLVLRTLTMGPECVRIRSAASTRRRALRV